MEEHTFDEKGKRTSTSEGLATAGPAIGCIVCLIVTLAVTIISIVAIVDGYHEIKEGYVGVYYKFGALQEGITEPGVHYMQPFVSTTKSVLIRPEETKMRYVEAITKDGIEISFEGISVLSRTTKSKVISMLKEYGINFKEVLIFDRVREDLRIFCANKTIDQVHNEEFLDIVEAVYERGWRTNQEFWRWRSRDS